LELPLISFILPEGWGCPKSYSGVEKMNSILKFPNKILLFSLKKKRIRAFCLVAVFKGLIFLISSPALSQDFFVIRDQKTDIFSNATQFISYRYMRHIWNTSDGVMAAVVQKGGYEGDGLVLYKGTQNPPGYPPEVYWNKERIITNDTRIVSDGVIDAENNILLVASFLDAGKDVHVKFIKMPYDDVKQSWARGTVFTVFESDENYRATRATIAIDSNKIIWSAFRVEDIINNEFQIKVRYSVDEGVTWNDIENGMFGTLNSLAEKTAKVFAVGNRIGMIYQDMTGGAAAPIGVKKYAEWLPGETEPVQTDNIIAYMTTLEGDPYSSHWSVAADDLGNIHLSYQDNGIKYVKYNGIKWSNPVLVSRYGNYNNISVATDNQIYLFSKNATGKTIIAKRMDQSGSKWFTISSQNYNGYLRMSSSERYSDHLPLIYEINYSPPHQLIFCLLDP
jgi:hypothetical protein